jgi:hypothetical protein
MRMNFAAYLCTGDAPLKNGVIIFKLDLYA